MNNTKRSLIFGASVLLSTAVFAILLSLFPNLPMRMVFYLTLYGVSPVCFFTVRRIHLRKALASGEEFFRLPAAMRPHQIRLILYVILAVSEYRFYGSLSISAMYFTILTFVVLTEIYLRLTRLFTQVRFYNNAVIVAGMDFRIDLPLNDPIETTSGTYGYGDFESARLKGLAMKLELTNKRGTLSMVLPEDKVPHIVAFLQSKRIPLERL